MFSHRRVVNWLPLMTFLSTTALLPWHLHNWTNHLFYLASSSSSEAQLSLNTGFRVDLGSVETLFDVTTTTVVARVPETSIQLIHCLHCHHGHNLGMRD